MGNTSSSGGGGGSGVGNDGATVAKQCYYELLAVDRSASPEEIKKAYKRKALELHPDRNYNDEERATKLFAEIQAAYEVLSDPQERAWYDSHREAILHGHDPSDRSTSGTASSTSYTTPDEVLSWFTQFPSKSKIDYSDSPTGFYSVLQSLFQKLADEEISACMEQGIDAHDVRYPSFGGSKSGYEDHVRGFYAQWSQFKTCKDFAWCDIFRLRDAAERQMRRAMEKENKRLRDKERRVFEENVRQFVQFVRKRDPRYNPRTQTAAQRHSELLAKSKEQAARARAANQAKQATYQAAEWMQAETDLAAHLEHLDDEYTGGEESDGGEDEDGEHEVVVWECVACRKTFKTEGQFGAHEKSKKHKQAVYRLRKKLEKEGRELGLPEEGEEEEVEEEEARGEGELDEGAHKEQTVIGDEELTPDFDDDVDEDVKGRGEENAENGKKQSPERERYGGGKDEDDEAEVEEVVEEEEEEEEEEEDDSDHVPISEFHARTSGSKISLAASLASTSLADADADADSDTDPSASNSQTSAHQQQQKMGKAKAKREKKKAAAADGSGSANVHKCVSCHQVFGSKSKVFSHLKEFPSHAAPVTASGKKGGKGAIVAGGGGAAGGGSGGGGKRGKGKKK